jgi:hypothetical protein
LNNLSTIQFNGIPTLLVYYYKLKKKEYVWGPLGQGLGPNGPAGPSLSGADHIKEGEADGS